MIENYIVTDKMVFMDNKGNVTILNEKKGWCESGLWFSNRTWKWGNHTTVTKYTDKNRVLNVVNKAFYRDKKKDCSTTASKRYDYDETTNSYIDKKEIEIINPCVKLSDGKYVFNARLGAAGCSECGGYTKIVQDLREHFVFECARCGEEFWPLELTDENIAKLKGLKNV
jgi:hypothetical protein